MQPVSNQTKQTESEPETKVIRLSAEQKRRLAHRSSLGIVHILSAQAVLAVLATLISGVLGGMDAAGSAVVGAGAYFIPNAIFAVRLLLGLLGGANAKATSFFWGEAFKLSTATALLALAVWQFYDWLVWPALLFGLISVLKGYVVLLALGKLP